MTSRRLVPAVIAVTVPLVILPAPLKAGLSSAGQARLSVVARHLNQPKKLTLAANGDLVVALSGDGRAPASCTDSAQASCEDRSGEIIAVTPSDRIRVLRSGLTSISSGHSDPQATGPVEARLSAGRLQVLFQDLDLNAHTGISAFGGGSRLGDLVGFARRARGRGHVEASLGSYEARHEPDRHALGSAVKYGYESAVNSDPYSFVPYHGGWAVADAGANDVLWVSAHGAVRVLAVLPTIREEAKAATYGSRQKRAITAAAQAVPTAVAVGPDGALYVGELGGSPFATGTEDIYRVTPDHRATVWATGFTSIADIGFDHGRLLVLELDKKGLSDPGLARDHPASGELISVGAKAGERGLTAGSRTVLLGGGLSMPTGLAVTAGGDVFLTNNGTATGRGQILKYIPPWTG